MKSTMPSLCYILLRFIILQSVSVVYVAMWQFDELSKNQHNVLHLQDLIDTNQKTSLILH